MYITKTFEVNAYNDKKVVGMIEYNNYEDSW